MKRKRNWHCNPSSSTVFENKRKSYQRIRRSASSYIAKNCNKRLHASHDSKSETWDKEEATSTYQ
ncbi:hypothetical protein IGI04_019567 [Brassica rapa subsp. trilocularis]|uniref:Uncharacterized protein n=1 Tax=Brassica rapa subsp. trilocularis TaxID=1813537 RepID=A0ABQ7MHT6_BRACM|nr:hypothetical protein IGI04_019567 [Brassica rapa subsp. trilocularis]